VAGLDTTILYRGGFVLLFLHVDVQVQRGIAAKTQIRHTQVCTIQCFVACATKVSPLLTDLPPVFM
jgi:hypothetical protein